MTPGRGHLCHIDTFLVFIFSLLDFRAFTVYFCCLMANIKSVFIEQRIRQLELDSQNV